ncbi:hypothetical protein [Intestinicryptomonas porci]|uniref:Uncharacterized protein n=1 Tax=Intestinicryptomonas porci TaxID=2926320 RepID=A0ABU4WDI2_9BACT|nr:hypothetical protein [Opitutales bacterium CLA-KB-P66]
MKITDKLIANRIQIVCRILSVVLFSFVFMLFICGAFANDFDFFDKTFRWLDNVLIVAAVALVLFVFVFVMISFKQKKRYELKTMLQIDSLEGEIAKQVSIELWNTSQEALKIEKIGFLSAQWQRKKVHGKFQEELVYFPVEAAIVSNKKPPFVLEAGALEVVTFDTEEIFSAYTIYKFFYDIAPAGRKLKIFDGDASEGCLRIRVKDKRLRLFSKKSKSLYLQVWLMLACFVAIFSALFLFGSLSK